MTSFLIILFVTFADIVGTLTGLVLSIQGLLALPGMYCHHCMGEIPWWVGLTQLPIGILFFAPNSLFRFLVKRLSLRAQRIGFLLRAVTVSALILLTAYVFSCDGVPPFWVWFVMLARPISAFALALEGERKDKKIDSEQIVGGDRVNPSSEQ
jgi:hypothetical protein